jgi:hypothetical protein
MAANIASSWAHIATLSIFSWIDTGAGAISGSPDSIDHAI